MHSCIYFFWFLFYRYLLQPKGNGTKSKPDDLGSLRLNVTYTEDNVLPSTSYTALRNLILKSPDVKVPQRHPATWRTGARVILFFIFRSLLCFCPSLAHLSVSSSCSGRCLQGKCRLWSIAPCGQTAAPSQQTAALPHGCSGSGAGEYTVE